MDHISVPGPFSKELPTPIPSAKPLEPAEVSNDIVKGLSSKNKFVKQSSITPTLSPTSRWRAPPTGRSRRRERIPTFRSQPNFIADADKNSWITPDTFEAPKIIQEISLVDPKREETLNKYIKYGLPIVTVSCAAHALYKDYVRMKQILKDFRDQKAERDRQNAIEAQKAELALQNANTALYAELERLRAEGNALWNDFQAKQESKAIYRELEAYDKKSRTRTMIDPTEELAQNEKQIADSRSCRARADIKPAALVFEPGRDDLWEKDIGSYISWV
jgi:hypothetical protein